MRLKNDHFERAHMVRKGLTLLLLVLLFSCSRKEPTVLKLENAWTAYEAYGRWQREEYFIIVNPPKDKFKLAKFIAAFNEATLTKEDILAYPGMYSRVFYRKTSFTMEIYHIENHNYAYDLVQQFRDTLFSTMWRYSDKFGITVSYSTLGSIYRPDNPYAWDIWHATDEELFYPWIRSADQPSDTVKPVVSTYSMTTQNICTN